jgi:hypothetical protein
MKRRLSRPARVLVGVVFVAGTLWGALSYRYRASLHCATCGAPLARSEFGVAVTESLRLPLRASCETVSGAETITRFLPPDHVHVPATHVMHATMDGPYWGETIWCRGRGLPNGFSLWLCGNGKFADYLSARIADGTTDLATVRALIAVPPGDLSAFAADPAHLALLRRGSELYGAWSGQDPRTLNVWALGCVDPFAPSPTAPR